MRSVVEVEPARPGPGASVAGAGRLAAAQPTRRSRHLAEILALLVMATWGGNVVAVKSIVADVPPILFACARFFTAFVVLLALLRAREGSVGLPRRDILPLAVLGFVGFSLYQSLWATALGQTTASNSALITAATPVSTMAIAAAIGSDTITGPKAIGALLALGGAAGVVGVTHGFGFSGASLGDLMTFLATICWSVYVAFGAPVLRRYSPLRIATWTIGFGSLGMLPLALVQLPSFQPAAIHPWTLVLFLFCGLLSGAASNVVMFQVVKVLGPGRTTLFQSLVPAFAVVAAAVFLGEAIVPGQIAGGSVIVAGILISSRSLRWRATPVATPPGGYSQRNAL